MTTIQSTRPKYLQLVERLQAQIESGDLNPGDRLPSYSTLRHEFGMTQPTVDRAFALLEGDGLIERVQGRGTFVGRQRHGAGTGSPVLSTDGRTVVAIARPDHSFFDRCVELLYEQTRSADLNLVWRPLDPENAPLLEPPRGSSRPLGFILFSYAMAPQATRLQDAGCRVVVVGVPPANAIPDVPCIYGDHEYGAYLVTRHLLEMGHRRIAYAGAANLEESLRWRGHRRALAEARQDSIQASTLLPAEIAAWQREPEAVAKYFRKLGAPTAVAAWNDHEAAALLGLLTRAGLRVPEDLSLAGYDNLPEGARIFPALTTVDHGIGQQLQAALNLLTRPTPPPPSHTVVMMPALIPRESTRTLR